MKSLITYALALGVSVLGAWSPALGAFNFVENFDSDSANWMQNNSNTPSNPLIDMEFEPAGGPDGGSYISRSFSLPNNATNEPAAAAIIIRGQQTYGSPPNIETSKPASGGGFVGNWLTEGVKQVTAYIRHDAGADLQFHFRFVRSANTPGGSYWAQTAYPDNIVPTGVWTKLTVDVRNRPEGEFPNITYGQAPNPLAYENVFSDISRIQINPVVPANFIGGQVTFDLDMVTVSVPEPATIAMAGMASAGAVLLVHRRRRK